MDSSSYLRYEFKAIRVVGSDLLPTKWTLKFDFQYTPTEENLEDFDIKVQSSFEKIRFWLDNFVAGSLILSKENEWAAKAFFDEDRVQTTNNQIVLLPSEPDDPVIAQVLQSKLNAISNGFMEFGSVDITSDDDSGLGCFFYGNGEENLPEMDEWTGLPNYFDVPWWSRNDTSTLDVVPPEGADLTEKPKFAIDFSFIDETFFGEQSTNSETQIIKPKFKPEVIKGGKHTD